MNSCAECRFMVLPEDSPWATKGECHLHPPTLVLTDPVNSYYESLRPVVEPDDRACSGYQKDTKGTK